MSEKPIIVASGISKKFNSSLSKPPRDGLRDLVGTRRNHLQKANEQFKDGVFWALQDISFEVFRGETLGIIGANGAGKSTLLKILSQIYRPTKGSFSIDGRVSSLLEVGTGFHQELSGRENIYFNGSLLGMKKSEIAEKFDEIVEFAEVEDFIDTPIKYYSSGMRAKLGFSVAVNLDAEVMIIDEALAVGDARFREKALKRMKESAFTGKTVLFVTHSMNFIEESCDRVLYIKNGKVEKIGEPKETLEAYLDKMAGGVSGKWNPEEVDESEKIDPRIKVESIQLLVNDDYADGMSVRYKDSLKAELVYDIDKKSSSYYLGYSLYDEQDRRLWRLDKRATRKGSNRVVLDIDLSVLKPGAYHVAADAFIENGKWVINPRLTKAKVGFVVADKRDDIINEKIEGIIKPMPR